MRLDLLLLPLDLDRYEPMHFLAFLPRVSSDETTNQPARLAEVGLADLHAGALWKNSLGPDNQAGCLIGWFDHKDFNELEYNPERQEWFPAVAAGENQPAGRYWIGFLKDQPPKPKELMRPHPFMGKFHRLGDGEHWLFPTPEALPHSLRLQDDGGWRWVIHRAFSKYVIECNLWYQRLMTEASEVEVEYQEAADFLVAAMRLNYRITPEVVDRLELIDSENLWKPIYVASGIQVLAENQREGR